jgi:hypothetical protein
VGTEGVKELQEGCVKKEEEEEKKEN